MELATAEVMARTVTKIISQIQSQVKLTTSFKILKVFLKRNVFHCFCFKALSWFLTSVQECCLRKADFLTTKQQSPVPATTDVSQGFLLETVDMNSMNQHNKKRVLIRNENLTDLELTNLRLVKANSWISLESVITLPLSPVKSMATRPFFNVSIVLSSISFITFCFSNKDEHLLFDKVCQDQQLS